ncbi:MAG: MarR family transcriptional regulator [Candidatus Omnitrophica bacterium]|nr:MarR family transcriptional regulator [Candidatus Omnitrophota bacterium]
MGEQEEFSTYFRAIQIRFSRFYARFLTQKDLTLQHFALLTELSSAGTISMTEASGKLLITKPAVTHLVDTLEKKNLIKRLPHPTDRRVYLLQIQPKGRKVVREIQGIVLRFLLKALHCFSAHEQKTVVRFYALLSHTIDEVLLQAKGKKG